MLRYVGLCVGILSVVLGGCSNEFSGDRYSSTNAGEIQGTEQGTVISLRKIEIKPEGLGAGALLGGAGGALLGSAFGKGGGKILTSGTGAIIGGVAGNAIQNKAQEGREYTVKLDSGAVITLAQGVTPVISVGQRVFIIRSEKGRSRVAPQ